MKRRKLALAVAMAIVLTSVPAGFFSVSAEELQDGFVAGNEETEDFSGRVEAEFTENPEETVGTGFQDGGDDFVSGETWEGVTEAAEPMVDEAVGQSNQEGVSAAWKFDESKMSYIVEAKPGESVTLKVYTIGENENLTYKWYNYNWKTEQDEVMEGVTSDTLEFVTNKRSDYYKCYVSDDKGCEQSCSFHVITHTGFKFVNELESENNVVNLESYIGTKETLEAEATADPGVEITYNWYKYVEEIDGKFYDGLVLIPDCTGPTYEVTVGEDDSSEYECIVTTNYGDTLERHFSIEINSGMVIESPEPVKVKPEEKVTLSAKVKTDCGPLTYKWKYMVAMNDIISLDGTGPEYIIEKAEKAGYYICEVSDKYNTKEIYFRVDIDSGFQIENTDWQKIKAEYGVPFVMHVNAKSNSPLQYQWYKSGIYNGGKIEGAISDSYEAVLDESDEEVIFYCWVTDGYNKGYAKFSIEIDTGLTVSAPELTYITLGEDVELKVTASTKEAYGPLQYIWYTKATDNNGDSYWKIISDATEDTIKTGPVNSIMEYRCVVKDKYLSKTVYMTVASKEYQGVIAPDFESAKDLVAGVENNAVIITTNGNMYFKFVPKVSGLWKLYSESDYNTEAILYDENKQELEFNDDDEDRVDFNDRDFGIKYELTAGKAYYLECKLFYDEDGDSDGATGSFIVKADLIGALHTHQWDDGKVAKIPTCTAKGEKTYTCTICGETKVEEIAKTAHNMVAKMDKAATCGVTGSQHKECSICGLKEAATEIPATGKHTMVVKVDKAATCGAAGSQHKECSVCGLKEAATEIPATGNHSYGEYTVTKEATAVTEGTKVRKCSVCGASDSAVIAKIPGTIQVIAAKVPLQVKKSIALSKLVTGFAAGDSINVSECITSKSDVAVIENGTVKAKKAGTTVVTIKLASGVSVQVTVTVQKKAVAATSINVVKNVTLAAGEKQKLTPVVSPITTLNKVTYSSCNKKVATVAKDGTITAKKSGTATIKVKCGKKNVNVKVKVTKKAPTGMTGVPATKTLKKGKSFTLKAKLTPSGAEAKITYKSSNSKIVSVTSKGKVKAKKKGTATITVKAGNVTKTCVVTVK